MENTLGDPSQPTLVDRVLVNRNFAFLWVGDVISALGDYSFGITMTLWILFYLAPGQPWAPLAITGLLLSGTLPALIVGPIAGVFVDRWNKRLTMIVADIIQSALVGVLVVTTFLPGGQLPIFWQLGVIYAVNFLLVGTDQFYNQAGFPLIGDIVPEAHFAKAMGRVLVFVSIGTMVGPAIGSPLFTAFGPRWALLINSMSFLVSLVLLLPIRPPVAAPKEHAAAAATAEKKKGFFSEFMAGLRFVWGSRVLRTMIIAMSIETLGTAAIPILNPFFAFGSLHVPEALFGLLVTALGVGALVGAIFGPVVVNRIGIARIFWLSLYADGILLIVYARLTSYIPALVVLFVLGCITGLFNVAIGPLILRVTPREMMGRGTAVRVALITAVNLVGTLIVGVLVSSAFRNFHLEVMGIAFGAIDTIFVVAGLMALLSGVYAMLNVFIPPPAPVEVAATETVVPVETSAE